MKLLVASDIHGSAFYCRKLMERYEDERPEKVILLGDILYHGPRNPLPEGYMPSEVAAMLNSIKSEILCVRGNCDSEVDQMVLDFPIMAEYAIFYIGSRMVYVTHGHTLNEDNLPMIHKGDILIHGHTHLKIMEDRGEFIYINPGSVSLPKDDDIRSYMMYEDGVFMIKDMDGKLIRVMDLNP